MSNEKNVLEMKDIHKSFGDKEILHGVSFSVESGSALGLLGRNGAGKTTSIRILMDVFRANSGEILLNGKSILHLKDKEVSKLRRSQIGFIYQDYSLLPEFTAYENIIFPIRLDGKTPEKAKIEELMEVLGILSCKDKFPGEMSGGEQQRVAIARAIAIQPAVILADEPTGNLDCENSNEVVTLMRKAAKMYHQTIIMVTHHMQTADYADRTICIQDGEIS